MIEENLKTEEILRFSLEEKERVFRTIIDRSDLHGLINSYKCSDQTFTINLDAFDKNGSWHLVPVSVQGIAYGLDAATNLTLICDLIPVREGKTVRVNLPMDVHSALFKYRIWSIWSVKNLLKVLESLE